MADEDSAAEVVTDMERKVNVEETVEKWIHDLMNSIPHLRTTEAYNRLRAAAEDLKNKLR